jgi:hypothetical protein
MEILVSAHRNYSYTIVYHRQPAHSFGCSAWDLPPPPSQPRPLPILHLAPRSVPSALHYVYVAFVGVDTAEHTRTELVPP